MNEDETNDETDADGHERTRTDTNTETKAPVDLTAPLQVKK